VSKFTPELIPKFSHPGAWELTPQSPFGFWGSPVLKDSEGKLFCPGFTEYFTSRNEWDVCFIGDIPTPGLCEVSVYKERLLDKKKVSGTDDTRLTFTGIEPAVVDIKITIWTPQQLSDLNDMWNSIFPTNSQRSRKLIGEEKNTSFPLNPNQAWSAEHPALFTQGVSQIILLGGRGPLPGSVSRTRVFEIRALEYIPITRVDTVSTIVKAQRKGHLKKPINDVSKNIKPGDSAKNTGP